MQKQRILKRISQATVVGLLMVQLFGINVNKPANAAGSIYVEFRTPVSSAPENVLNTPVQFKFTDGNGNNVSHGKITIYYEITGTADNTDYVFNNQPGVVMGSVSVPAGAGDFSVNLQQSNDTSFEGDEDVVVQITGLFYIPTLGGPVVSVGQSNIFSHTILDDDGDQVGNINVTNFIDASTISQIYPPHAAVVQLGKWKLGAVNESVDLNKISFQAVNPSTGAVLDNLHTFFSLSLYEGNNLLGVTDYVNGDVVFNGINSTIPVDSFKVLTLKGETIESGQFNSNVPVAFVIKSDNNADMEMRGLQTSALLGSNHINYNLFSNNGPAESQFARSTVYNFHDAFPVMSPISLGNNLPIASAANIFKFSITNGGTRNLRIGQMTISHAVSGLAPAGSISNFRLFQDDGTQNPPMLGQNNTVVNAATPNPVLTPFSNLSVSIAPGATAFFVVKADTTDALDGKTSGSIAVSSKIAGSNGWNGSSWNNGDLHYFYTPAGKGATEQGPYSHSDSYEVQGGVLIFTL